MQIRKRIINSINDLLSLRQEWNFPQITKNFKWKKEIHLKFDIWNIAF